MTPSPLPRLRRICLALPLAHEVEAWGEPTFRVKNKLFAMFAAAGNHHGAGRPAVWCKAGPGNQELMIRAEPGRYFSPPYVGKSGWVGIWLDRGVDWRMVADVIADSHALIAPKARALKPEAKRGGANGAAKPAGRGTQARASELPAAMGKPALRAFETAGLRTLAAVARRTEKELAALHGVGPKAIRVLKAALEETGRRLRSG